MDLSLTDASHLLGKTPRQVRYMIKNGHLQARKIGRRWVIDDAALPLTEGQRRAHQRKATELREAVDHALGPHTKAADRKYSVRQITAFSVGAPLLHSAKALLDDAHPAVDALAEALVAITQGCHRYHDQDKLAAYQAAREHTCRAVALVLIGGQLPEVAEGIEQQLIPALNGLIRRCERKARR